MVKPAREKEKARASKDAPQVKQEDRRQHLLAAAIDVFAEKTFEGATVKDIADHAEMNVAMVSYYFESKEGLYRACLESMAWDRFTVLEKMLTAPISVADFRSKIQMFVESCIQDQIDQPQIIQMVQNEIHHGLPHARSIFKDTFLRLFEVLVGFLDQAKKAKFIRSDCDSRFCAMFIHGSLMNLASTEKMREEFIEISMRDPKIRKKTIEQFTNMILDGTTRGTP